MEKHYKKAFDNLRRTILQNHSLITKHITSKKCKNVKCAIRSNLILIISQLHKSKRALFICGNFNMEIPQDWESTFVRKLFQRYF